MQVKAKYPKFESPYPDVGKGTALFFAFDLLTKTDLYDSPDNIYEYILSSEIDLEPGSIFYYENDLTETLTMIAKKVTGKTFVELIQENIWAKIGAEKDALIDLDPGGNEISCIGLKVTLRDLARFGEMMRNNGYFNNEQILSKKLLE